MNVTPQYKKDLTWCELHKQYLEAKGVADAYETKWIAAGYPHGKMEVKLARLCSVTGSLKSKLVTQLDHVTFTPVN